MRIWPLALIAGLAAAAPAHAFRCGTKLVHEGDTRGQVISKCGEPAEIDQRSILRRPVFWIGGRPFHVGDGFVDVSVEIWVYNLGPNKLMRRVRFEDGLVVEIETLGYGYRDG
ncbi:MAG TPA: DUF2845 domain-containing protein [Steroidobacteraceae bacterium]|nr:DUF2845 domain-containing protein [Steroidobacteraceae bacterium]